MAAFIDSKRTNIDELSKLTCEVIRQLVTTVLTLSTTLIAAAIAFVKIVGADGVPFLPFIIGLSFFVGTILFGLLCLMTIVSSLANEFIDVARNRWVSTTAGLHILSFFFGICCLLWMAIKIAS